METMLSTLIFHIAATLITQVIQYLTKDVCQSLTCDIRLLYSLKPDVRHIKGSGIEMGGFGYCVAVLSPQPFHIILGTQHRGNDNPVFPKPGILQLLLKTATDVIQQLFGAGGKERN
jgi:hypothetical protein